MTALANSAGRRLALLLPAIGLLVGCGLMQPEPMDVPDEGGMGLPVKNAGEEYEGEPIPFSAELTVSEEGCAYLDFNRGDMLAIWPSGSELSEPVRLADGTELAPGDIVRGLGTVVLFNALPGGPDGYWAFVTGFCAGEIPQALVVDEISEVQ
jgi:hypothetical protein